MKERGKDEEVYWSMHICIIHRGVEEGEREYRRMMETCCATPIP